MQAQAWAHRQFERRIQRAPSIFCVTDNRMPGVCRLHPDLVHAPRFDAYLQQAGGTQPLHLVNVGQRPLVRRIIPGCNTPLTAAITIFAQMTLQLALLFRPAPMHQTLVLLAYASGIVRALISMGDRTAAAQLSSLLLAAVFAVLMLERWSRQRLRFHHTSSKYRALPRYDLGGWRALLAILACLAPVALGFLLPAALLAGLWLEDAGGAIDRRFLGWAGNSMTLAGVTALLAVALALALAYGMRFRRSASLAAATRLAGMGYALPGTVIAIGTLIPLAHFDNALDAWMRETFGIGTGLLLTGGIAALVFAYLVRFLSVSLSTVEASLGKVRPSLDEAARSLGQGPRGTLLRVHAPLVWSGLLTAFLVVFVDVMKELPATLLLRPFNFDTLATFVFQYASDELLEESALGALTIVGAGIIPVILLSVTIARSRPGSR